ncbi:MAG TPA: hypothetical protein VN754_01685 [Candidatus Binataceae bacterium]|nr:hypothetical protein [Candidatus Binataceae bacterium]
MTRFASCFLLVFAELAFGGMTAIAVPPFFKVERGFYKSSASVYLAAGLIPAVGFALLAMRRVEPQAPASVALWVDSAVWILFCSTVSVYLVTLWTDHALLRARAYVASLIVGLIGVIATSLTLKPTAFGPLAVAVYTLSGIFSSAVLGFASVGMLFGHWYLIDPNLPVDYLRTIVRLLGHSLIGELIVLFLVVGIMALGGHASAQAVATLFHSDSVLLAMRLLLGPVASITLAWMTWQTLKIPQTMAATGLLYIAVMSVLVGEFIGRFILFRTALPL